MLADSQGGATRIAAERLLNGRVWNVERVTLDLHGTTLERDVVQHPGAVGILAVNERDEVALVRQYRTPVDARLWEIPAGLLDIAGEDPLDAAKRELAEEADVAASDWALLLDVIPSGGGSSEVIRVYVATGITALPDAFEREAEEAFMEQRWVPFEEAVHAALSMQLHNGPTLAALLALDAMRRRGMTPGPATKPFTWHPETRATGAA